MPSLSSLVGGGGVPVGGIIPLWGASDNPTINGVEYLRTGVLKAIAGYTALSTSNPMMTYNVPVASAVIDPSGSHARLITTSNGYCYAVNSANSVRWCATPLGTWSVTTGTSVTDTILADYFPMGTRLVGCDVAVPRNVLLGVGTIGTGFAFGAQHYGASNSAGTLAVFAGTLSSANGLQTSTDGVTWTPRTSSIVAAVARSAAWCEPLGAFIYFDANANIYSTTDGFTLTSRGLITTGATAVAACNGRYHAESPTVNLWVATVTVSGVAQNYLIRTTNGTSYTATPLPSIASGFSGSLQYLRYANGVFYLGYGSSQATSVSLLQSTDGITWTPFALPLDPALTTNSNLEALMYTGGKYYMTNSSASSSRIWELSGAAATHVGAPIQSWQYSAAAQTQAPLYVRIK